MRTFKNQENMITKDYILAIRQNNNLFECIKIPCNRPQALISELKAMVENPNRTIYDMQCHFFANYNWNTKFGLKICYPHEYYGRYLPIQYPPEIKTLAEIKNHWLSKYNSYKKDYGLDMAEKKLEEYKKDEKEDAFMKYENWITINEMHTTTSNVKNTNNILMYSTENIGWTDFNYKINNDFEILIRTNFGYGESSYFNLTIKYKDLEITPYSHLVQYYYANAHDLIGYTRKYVVARSSWEYAFDFVVDTVNKAQDNTENFIKGFIIGEIKEMMSGLKYIVYDTDSYFDEIKKKNEENVLKFSNNNAYINPNNKRIANDIGKQPLLFLWKIHKVTQGLCLLDNLKNVISTFAEFEEYINECIDTLLSYNIKIYPEVKNRINEFETSINLYEEELKKKEKEKEELDSKLAPYNKELDEIRIQNPPQDHKKLMDEYKEKNREYKELCEERQKIANDIANLNSKIYTYKGCKETLNKSMELIESVCEVE